MEFEDYIKPKIREALDANKKQGPRRDIELLTSILIVLFWQRSSINRTIYDILPALGPKYKNLRKDTLEDNLEYLSKTPEYQPFLRIFHESQEITVYNSLNVTLDQTTIKLPSKKGKPKNIYMLNGEYITDYYKKECGLTYKMGAYIAPPQ